MSWDSEDEMMEDREAGWRSRVNQEERVIDCFERSASEWLRGEDLKAWSGCGQGVLDDLVELGKLEEAGWWALGTPENERWWAGMYRLAAAEPQAPRRRRMKFAVGHPRDIEESNIAAVFGWSTWPSAERFSYDEVVSYVSRDDAVLVTTQDPRPLDAMGPDNWRDLKARVVLVRRHGVVGALTDQEAQEVMADYDLGLQNLSEIIRQRVVLD